VQNRERENTFVVSVIQKKQNEKAMKMKDNLTKRRITSIVIEDETLG